MSDEKLEKQIEKVDQAVHRLFRIAFTIIPELKTHEEEIISSGVMHIIQLAYKNPDLILKEIREYMNLPQTTLSSKIARLEKMGLARRVINHRDMRSFSLEVTEKGKKLYEEHRKMDYHLAKEGLLALEEDERDLFINMLNKLTKRLSK